MNPFRYGQIVKENDFCLRPKLEMKWLKRSSEDRTLIFKAKEGQAKPP